jgi:signal transduction histidine kinase
VEVAVVDDGRGPGNALHEGHGLLGMRERVALFHGSLDVEPNRPSGLAVRARLLR